MTTDDPPARSTADALRDMPLARWFGLRFGAPTGERARVSLPLFPELLQSEGIVHGGVLSTLADTAAVHVLQPVLAPGERMTSIEFKLNFLAPATLDGEVLVAEARALRRGRTILLAEVDVHQGATLVARGTFTYLRMAVR